jgi:hypothetical protein
MEFYIQKPPALTQMGTTVVDDDELASDVEPEEVNVVVMVVVPVIVARLVI